MPPIVLASGDAVPLGWVAPFAVLLLCIAVLPLTKPHFWEHNRNKGIVAALLSLPVAVWLFTGPEHGTHWLEESLLDYAAFIGLLGALFTISGGIYLRGSLAGTPLTNTGFLAVGGLIASFVGTTGASMLLIRPLLRANAARQRKAHIVIFFIFAVSNAGGLLTPLGDPPLFLGFLNGVPFTWTFRLWVEWATVLGALLVVFNVWDQRVLDKEEVERPGSQLEEVQKIAEPLSIQGKANLILLLGVLAVSYFVGGSSLDATLGLSPAAKKLAQTALYVGLAGASLRLTSKEVRAANRFGWGPIIEVAVLFAGIFVTMIPAVQYLEVAGRDGTIHLHEPWQFFWASGALSSFLDNAPTYKTFASLAVGVLQMDGEAGLGVLTTTPAGNALLTAVACGSVFMGANTYIGNGPNFMVKAIAEENGVKMPSFFGYMIWSVGILVPLFVLVTFVFFR
ncbi:MAG: sodium:proton antiporter [Planctomycetes bacterium]|nr:sodium:proton antiporter [Planctomycetota bacterium]